MKVYSVVIDFSAPDDFDDKDFKRLDNDLADIIFNNDCEALNISDYVDISADYGDVEEGDNI